MLEETGRYRYPVPNQIWLELRREAVLEPDLPIVDPHHHLWEHGAPYLGDEILEDVSCGHAIGATVFVQCFYDYLTTGPEVLRPVGETRRVASIAESLKPRTGTRVAAGIVAFADLTAGDAVEALLDAHEEAAGGRLVGIRQPTARDENFPNGIVTRPAPAGMMAEAGFRAGIGRLARRGLTFDAMVYHSQIRDVEELARAVPDARIVLDHIGCPLGVGPYENTGQAVFDDWSRDISRLAKCPNVWLKFGGLGMVITGAAHHLEAVPPGSQDLSEAWRPWFEVSLACFGPDRIMFESNFPVDKGMFSYTVLWNAFKRLSSGLTGDERACLFSRTATMVYGLDAR